MTETTKEIFEKYQVRKTKKQKTSFIEYVKQIAESYEYDFKVEKDPLALEILLSEIPTRQKFFIPLIMTPALDFLFRIS
ncbi:MAG: hypothetical protein IIW79_04415 [Clostridia bacterium]|nr:hypothetical protein [Clostridia bacterium]